MTYVTKLRGAGLPPAEYMVLMMVWTYSNEDMVNAFPSLNRLAEDTGLSKSTVKRCLRSLRTKGYLTVDARGGNVDGKNLATRYRLTLPAGGGVTHEPPGGHQCTPGGVTHDPLSDHGSDHESDPSLARPSQAMSLNVARSILTDHPTDEEDSSSPPDRADAADPVGPDWRRSPERAQMVQAVRVYAKLYHSFDPHQSMDGHDEWLEQREQIEDWFDHTLETALGADRDGVFSAAANDRGWTPPKRVIDSNLEAGIWLNKFLHWIQGDDGYAEQSIAYERSAA